MKTLRSLLFALGVLALITQQSMAATLYGATAASGSGELYILNPATGASIEPVGPLNDATSLNYPMTGLAFHPATNVLYGSSANSDAATRRKLVTINRLTAQVTVIGDFNVGNATMTDLAFDSAGNLYGVGSVGGPQLYSININTGQATVIGGTGLTSTSGGGLAVSPGGVFYGTPTSSRYGTYDPMTGAYTNITNPVKPTGGGTYGAFDFDGDVLYGINLAAGQPPPQPITHLVTIDPATGAVTDIGASVDGIDAIAIIPEPATMTLLVGAVAIGLISGRRRK